MIGNLKRLADVPSKLLEWLWFPYIARGALTVIEGEQSIGKSLFLVDLVARLSRGGPMPDGTTPTLRVRSLFFTPEESLERSLRPRLESAGADLEAIYSAGSLGRPVLFPWDDLQLIHAMLEDEAIDVLVIDALEGYLPDLLRPRQANQLRRWMANLADVAAQKNIAIVIVGRTEGKKPSPLSSLGSVGVTLRVSQGEEETERVVEVVRSVLGPRKSPGAFRIVGERSAKLEWLESVEASPAPEVSFRPKLDPSVLEAAIAWLAGRLADGPKWTDELFREGRAVGFTERTLELARSALRTGTDYAKYKGRRRAYWVTKAHARDLPLGADPEPDPEKDRLNPDAGRVFDPVTGEMFAPSRPKKDKLTPDEINRLKSCMAALANLAGIDPSQVQKAEKAIEGNREGCPDE